MNSSVFEMRSTRALALSAGLLCLTAPSYAQQQAPALQAQPPYPRMAAVAEYLSADQNAEIALARSAAPAALSRDATILVLGQHGYETAVKGGNGFVCVVERSWMNRFDSPEFWNPKMRGPVCLNPQAVRSVLPYTIKRTQMVLAGASKEQLILSLKQTIASRQIPALEPGAMSYMLSKNGNLGDSIGHWHPHLMFYGPKSDGADWGANLPSSPVLIDPAFRNEPEPINTYFVLAGHWSDGTLGPEHDH